MKELSRERIIVADPTPMIRMILTAIGILINPIDVNVWRDILYSG